MNSKESNNRSVRNTKRRLKDCLLTMLGEKPVSSISVKELCEQADVNRGTFYFHYSDIYDMMGKIEAEYFVEYNAVMTELSAGCSAADTAPLMLLNIFRFMRDNSEFCRVLLGPNGDRAFLERCKALVADRCSDIWKNTGSHLRSDEYALLNSFIINGFIGLMETWLIGGCQKTAEEMATIATAIIIPAARATLAAAN
ncbi:MAG: TetR-like C-terminal domain-containing protein [Oscillospiraceae bacterium]